MSDESKPDSVEIQLLDDAQGPKVSSHSSITADLHDQLKTALQHTKKTPLIAAPRRIVTMSTGELTLTALKELKHPPYSSNSVATQAQVHTILTNLAAYDAKIAAPQLLEFVMLCVDQGSSSATHYAGTIAGVEAHTDVNEIARHIKQVCSLRKLCMYYAKYAFHLCVVHNRPPANWQRKGFTDSTKYAAFDFFNGVTNGAALNPPGGMVRQPTAEEITAHALNAHLLIARSRQNDIISTAAEITGMRTQASSIRARLTYGPD
ncbi:coat protein [Sclerotinia sclerotiorum alphaflexivirus 1]|nr:coat protein [Sclerotinia sclerotiorum alphaflexivirus 1]